MSNERRQILEMLAQGKISAEDAERLLDKVNAGAAEEGIGAESPDEATGGRGRPKYLRVLVTEREGDKVNIRVPLAFVRAGINLAAVIPQEARKHMEDKGVSFSALSQLKGEEFVEALRELTVDVEESDGSKVKIFCD